MGVIQRATRCVLQRSAVLETLYALLLLSSLVVRASAHAHDALDNEFAEFEEFDEAPAATPPPAERSPPPAAPPSSTQQPPPADDARAHRDDAFDDFDDLDDDNGFVEVEEADGDADTSGEAGDAKARPSSSQQQPMLKIVDVPAHLRNNWTNYQVEGLMILVLVVYIVNYLVGKQHNQNIATLWFDAHQEMLNEQFALVGDDGSDAALDGHASYVRETDSTVSLWCSGRAGVLGMLVQLKLIKRHDLASVLLQLVRPRSDHVSIRVELEPGVMDTYVGCVGQRKAVAKLTREMTDLSMFTAEKKNGSQLGLPASFGVQSEIAEATTAMLDAKVLAMLKKYETSVEYVHFSDQYSGIKPQEGETVLTRAPDTSSVVVLGYNLPSRMNAGERDVEECKPLISLVLHLVEKARRFRLSREGKQRADKNRLAAQESFLKTTHAQRAEAAAARREEKIRERKQRMMEEEDPEKQRQLERQEQRREAKKKQPRMKQLKIKSM